jgi:ABC-2 type transport system permease protein
MLAIYKKEMRAYFHSIIGYLFIGFFLAIIGLYYFMQNIYSGYATFAYSLYGVRFFFILLIPMVTMRIMAEENRQKTDQLLFTSPISITKIIIGKYLAVISMMAIVMVIACAYPLVMSNYGEVNLKAAYVSILAFFLMGCTYLAIGMFISAMTESQAFAAIMTFVVVLVTSLASTIGGILPTDNMTAVRVFVVLVLIAAFLLYAILHNITFTVIFGLLGEGLVAALYILKPTVYDGLTVKFFDWLTISTRLDDFLYGIFSLSAFVYFVTVTFLFVFLTIQAIKKRRWS